MTAIQEYKWNNYVRKHPSCDKPALREIFIAGWNASHGVSETDAQKIEDWNKRQTTIDFDSI